MANRSCPLCSVRLTRAMVLARSQDLVCPSCHSVLELSRNSRVSAGLFGVLLAYLAVQLTLLAFPQSAWVIAVVAAVLAYGFGSALFLLLFSDLVVRPTPAAPFPHISQ